ncbi:GNAT family N-acetyltransferase [Desulfogranum marinum]|uniref:GNAT family N-acetyltransferase n=1 Tax=Desulfogranum marinum TaxID=453220 RepID=UPI0029C8091C|nr:GNAT family N-acetyltransferase [Desulfogranum marinum]
MQLIVKNDCSGVEWEAVAATLQLAGMAFHDPDKHRRAFEASYAVVFLYDSGKLIGFGRAISDGEYQAAIYDCAVTPSYQGKGLGRVIMENLHAGIAHCNIILYASPGKEGFYEKYHFRRMKTGMALFTDRDAKKEKGFTE